MASDVDICNLALSHLGDEAQVIAITPPDGTVQAAHCARFYPMARAQLLELHPWTFATKRAALAQVTNTLPDDWQYAYALPSTCIRPLAALTPGAPAVAFNDDQNTDAGSQPFIVEADADGNPVLFTNVEAAALRYIDLVTDTSKYTPLFTMLLARLLASHLAGPILKGDTGMKVAETHLQIFEREFLKAATRNANVGKRDLRSGYVPGHLAARGTPTRICE